MKTKLLIAVVVVLVVIQFFKPEKNVSGENKNDVSTKYAMSDSVKSILAVACNDCHSNRTEYPWYSNIQPVAWWLNNHVQEGKRELNFSEFASYKLARQNHKFEETIEMLDEGEMPLSSYTWFGLHPQAKLSEQEKNTLKHWARTQMDTLKAQYPPDSLTMKRR